MADLQDIRLRLVSGAQGVSGGTFILYSGRVSQGLVPVTRTTGSGFWASCTGSGSGAFAHVRHGRCVDGDPANAGKMPGFEVKVDCWAGVDKDVSNNLSGAVKFIEALRKALNATVTYGEVTFDDPEVEQMGPVSLLHYVLVCTSKGCGT